MKSTDTDPLDDLLQKLQQERNGKHGLQNRQLADRILANLPPQDNVVAIKPAKKSKWMPIAGAALAASLVAIAMLVPLQDKQVIPGQNDAFEQWAWEEVLDETPASDAHTELAMLALLEPGLVSTDFSDDEF